MVRAAEPPVWQPGPPAPPRALAELAERYPGLPEAYLQFLREQDGSEGEMGVQPWWVQLWPAAEVARDNAEYEVERWLPGFVGFASSGGGELFAFDTRTRPWRVCMVPFIPMDPALALEIEPDFAALTRHFGVAAPPE
jgi:hypothetical protein